MRADCARLSPMATPKALASLKGKLFRVEFVQRIATRELEACVRFGFA